MGYSLRARCIAEIIGTAVAIYVGESSIANALLTQAKGQNMGFGFIAASYATAFVFPALCLGHISAYTSPAFAVAALTAGKLDWGEFFALSFSEMLGGFIGALLVWMHWWPHLNLVPQPPPELAAATSEAAGPAASDDDKLSKKLAEAAAQQAADGPVLSPAFINAAVDDEKTIPAVGAGTLRPYGSAGDATSSGAAASKPSAQEIAKVQYTHAVAMGTDQALKLMIFCTKPAIYHPLYNFIVEFSATIILLTGILLMQEQGVRLATTVNPLVGAVFGYAVTYLYVGWWLFILVLGLGGPTGFAVNPARDLPPRFAHWLLPIANKGSSEWHYSWIPVVAPMLGGAVSGGLYLGLTKLN